MPRYKNFSACVKCDNQLLREYGARLDAQDPTSNTYSCWVSSEEDKQFSIHYECEADEVDYRAIIYIDGIRTAGSLVVSRDRKGGSSHGVSVDSRTLKPYIFSNVQLTDDETLADIRVQASNIGEVTIKIFRVEVRKRCRPSFRGKASSTSIPDGMIFEGKKVSGHRTVLGGMIQKQRKRGRGFLPASAKYTWFGIGNESERNPYVTFKFFYRSESTLQALGLLPPSSIVQGEGSEEKIDAKAVEETIFRSSPLRSAPSAIFSALEVGNIICDSPEHAAVKRSVREVIDLYCDGGREVLAAVQCNLTRTRGVVLQSQKECRKGGMRQVKCEIVDLTLE